MYFDSLQALIAMDGHGPYVWGAYGMCFVVMAALVAAPIRRQAALKKQIRQQARRES